MVFLREEVLKDVISEVFETMFFTEVDFKECEGGGEVFEFGSQTRLANQEGCMVLTMRIGEKFARMITANFLGMDEGRASDIDEEQLVDSLKELSNMVAGGCQVHASDTECILGIPLAWRTQKGEGDSTGEVYGLCFTFSGEPVGAAALEYAPCGDFGPAGLRK